MKPGFGKSNKKKNKQKKKSGKGKRDGDDIMQDAATVPGSPVQMPAESAAATSPQSVTARDKQRQRMELKKALRVKVANLKSDRHKLTKLSSDKTKRRQINKQLQGLLQDRVFGKDSKKQETTGATAATGGPAAADMAE